VTSNILEGLNPQQREAVSAGDGPVLVLAGPGSGKTRVLTHRIAYLVEEMDVPAWRIMAVTFTNKAARAMEDRVLALLEGSGKLDGLTIGTFHAICARILRQEADYTTFSRDYVIFDTDDQLQVMKQAVIDLNLDPKIANPRTMLNKVSAAKNELITPATLQVQDYRDEQLRRVYARYDELLRASNARDFDDLLMHVVLLFQNSPETLARYQHRYLHVLVDEFQDTNMAQYMLVRLLAGERKNIFAVGDPDQSIYAFRGADYRNVKRFEEDFPQHRKILLEENYRSHQAILDAAMGVIDQNTDRTPKSLFSQRKEGPRLFIYEAYNEEDEARFVVETIAELSASGEHAPGDVAIMYRTNAQSRALEEAFLRAGMPYRLIGATRFYGRKEIKDLIAYLRLIHNPDDGVSLARIINVPTRGIGLKTLDELEAWARELGTNAPGALQLLPETPDAPLAPRSIKALLGFWRQVEDWREIKETATPEDLLKRVLNDTGYLDYITDGTPQGEDRVENVLELRAVAASYGNLPLATFLEEVALVSDVDNLTDEASAPTLLTLHSAKGLEFPVVFLVGLEENLMPHARSLEAERNPRATPEEKAEGRRALEEERRLMYVGITRAEHRLYLSYAAIRSVFGDRSTNLPSRFLYDIPEEVRDGAALRRRGAAQRDQDAFRAMTTWASPTSRAQERARSVARPAERSSRRGPSRFKAGQVVWHTKYGEGVVVSSESAGEMEQVRVLFPGGVGEKVIVADFLKPVDEK